MWKFAGKNAAGRKPFEKDKTESRAERVPLQFKDETKSQDLSYEDMRIYYSLPSPNRSSSPESSPNQEVIQQKQTTPLNDRFQEQGINTGDLGPDVARLVKAYDDLPNSADTGDLQINYLRMILDTLSASLHINTGNPQMQTAMRILQDELSFVNAQRRRQDSGPLTPPDNPWKHMDSSPLLRTIAAIADEESRGNRMSTPSVEPVTGIPSPENFSAFEMIRTLSAHHIKQLTSPNRLQSKTEFYNTFFKIKKKLSREGMLSHYTHNPNINVLHSTDHLKANRILEREKLSKSDTVSEGENVSKSQDVDTDIFRNTGFVFFFLERAGSTHRPKTDFGKYRYTVRLADNLNILNDAWAIFHDMAGRSSSDRPIWKGSPVHRIIESSFNPEAAINWFEHFNSHPSPFLTSDKSLFSILSMFLPSANQRFALRTSDNITYYTEIEEHLSGNFLQGENIIDGIALRIAHELMTLQNCSEAEYNVLMSDDNAFWEYVSGMVHDLQVMIPHDVLPSQCDFQEGGRISVKPVTAEKTELRHISGQDAVGSGILRASANNCFFDAMFPIMENERGEETANSNDLRALFIQRQCKRGLNPLPVDAPIEYQHVQQFADIFNVFITVLTETPDHDTVLIDFMPQHGSPANHYYIRYLPPKLPDGIGHYTNL